MAELNVPIQKRTKPLHEMNGGTITSDGRHKLLKHLLHADACIMCLSYIPNVDIIAGGLSNGKTFLYSIPKGIVIHTLQNNNAWKKHLAITSLQNLVKKNENESNPSNSKILLTTNVTGDVLLWNWHEKIQLKSINEPQAIYGTAVDHETLITVGKNSSVNLYNINTFQLESSFKRTTQRDVTTGHASRVFAAKFHPINENEFVTGGWDNLVLFWDKRQEQPIRYVFGPHICGESIDITSDGQKLLTCSWSVNDSVQVWDYKTAKLMSTITEDQYSPKNYAGKWATNEVAICGGSDPNALRVVIPNENNVLGGYSNLPGGVYAIQFCSSKASWPIQQKTGVAKISRAKFTNDVEEEINLPAITFCSGPHLYYTLNK